jgi:anaerobic ribonucleoside-triphosphate reductase activating protein
MNEASAFSEFSPEALSERVLSVKGVEGVTLSGGEPFAQDPESMGAFLSAVRSAGSGVMAYTGFRIEELESVAALRGLLVFIDLLVDGPYVETEDHGERWRGSSNQRFHFLTDRYSRFSGWIEEERNRSIEVDLGGEMTFSFAGIPPRDFQRRLEDRLRGKGMEIDWSNSFGRRQPAQKGLRK